MSNQNDNRPISPEIVAAKIAAIRNFEFPEILDQMTDAPRCAEVLHFLQYVSQPENYTGGLRKFTADFLAASVDMIGSEKMRSIGKCSLERRQALEIFASFPQHVRVDMAEKIGEPIPPVAVYADPIEYWDRKNAEREMRKALENELVLSVTWRDFEGLCVEEAKGKLHRHLRRLCEEPTIGFFRSESKASTPPPWYFSELTAALIRFIDHYKSTALAQIAETEITRSIFSWLDKARRTSRSVLISGNSRFGKTEALRTWAKMNAGVARLVNTPASNSEGDLLREVAKALGIDIGPGDRGNRLRDRITFVLSHSRPMLLFDEAQMIFPANFTKNTAPARLNFVRRSIMDAGLPCAFCCTPQSYQGAKKRFVKATGYAIEQFDERLLKTVELPEEISRADLLAIARIHFRKLPDAYLEHVVSIATATERNYVSDIEKIAALANDNAQEAGRAIPLLEDIKAAMADVLPVAPSAAVNGKKDGELTSDRTRSAGPIQAPCRIQFDDAVHVVEHDRNRLNFDTLEGPALAGFEG